jgi:hypothetical protein
MTREKRAEGMGMTSEDTRAAGAASAGGAGALPFDSTVAHQARMYDYVLGGKDNYKADRDAAEAWLKVDPDAAFTAWANRAFLGRAVGFLAGDVGIRQFLDIGTGIATTDNTHQVAQAIAPASRVVYVDYDPIVLAHARALLTSSSAGATDYVDADLRDTGAILSQAAELLDFTKPVAVTMLAVLHAIPDSDDPHAIVATIMDAVPSGSYLAISHGGSDLIPRATRDGIRGVSNQMQQRIAYRDREEVARFFAGLDLAAPGLVRVEEWRPEPDSRAGRSSAWCAVGRKR